MYGTFRVGATELPIESAGRRMQELRRFWDARRHGSSLPVWPDFDVTEMRSWLGRVSLYEGADSAEFRVRLRGSALTPRAGAKERQLVQAYDPGDYGQIVCQHFRAALSGGNPTRHVIELSIAGARYSYDRLVLPLAATDKHPARLLTYIECDPLRARVFWEAYASSGEFRGRHT